MQISTLKNKNLHAYICWAYAEKILLHAEHMRNRFHRTLSIRGTNFHACSASDKMWTFFTCTIHAEHTRNKFFHTLSIRGTNFIACWAYTEPISSHAEHARKYLKFEYLGRIEYVFKKSHVTGPWDHMVSVSAKKVKKEISCLCTFNMSKVTLLRRRSSQLSECELCGKISLCCEMGLALRIGSRHHCQSYCSCQALNISL